MKKSTLALSVLLCAAAGYAIYLQVELRSLQSQLAASLAPQEESTTDAEQDSAAAANAAAKLEAASTASAENASAVANAAAEEQPERRSREERRREWANRMIGMFEDPNMRLDLVERQLERIDSRYADFFTSLDLAPEELETLRTLMAERSVSRREWRTRAFSATDPDERAKLEEEGRFQRDLLTEKIDTVLGEKNAVAMQSYQDSIPYREKVETLATRLNLMNAPLREEQSERLVQSMLNVSQDFEYTRDLSDRNVYHGNPVSGEDIETYFREREDYDQRLADAAAKTLSGDQLEAFLESQLAERERDRRQMEFWTENGGGPRGGRGRGGPRGGG